ncbi:MAG: alpha/beta hydrolase [Pseudorhodobacter sp.]|nr:alpha/beta hydrolase [Pseudorhodobacter sp.]
MVVSTLLAAGAVLGGGAVLIDRSASRREAWADHAYPPTGQFVTVAGKRVHVVVTGRGPDLVLIHGASGNARDYTFALAGLLADSFRVIVFDRPGLGWSEGLGEAGISPAAQADHLRAAAAQLGVRRPLVLGHSYGGAVALAWGLAAPTETAALVVVSGATMPWVEPLDWFFTLTSNPYSAALAVPLLTAFAPLSRLQTDIAAIFKPFPVPPGYGDYVGAGLTLRRDSLHCYARQVAGLKACLQAMSARYPDLALPIELVHGGADSVVPLAVHSAALVRLLPDAVLTVLAGAGHMPHHSHARDVIAAVHRAAARAGLRDAARTPVRPKA